MLRSVFAGLMSLALFVAPMAAGAASSPPVLPSVESFAAQSQMAQPELAPDGLRLAYFTTDRGDRALVVKTLDTGDAPRVVFRGDGNLDLEWFTWLNDERMLLAVSYPGKRGATATIETRLLSFAPDGSRQIALLVPRQGNRVAQVGTDIIATVPGDPLHILINWDRDLDGVYSAYRVNVVDGKAERLEDGQKKTAGWLADEAGVIRIRIDYDGSYKELWIRDQATAPFRLLKRYDVFRDPSFTPLAFAPDNPQLLYVTSDEGDGRDAVYAYDLTTNRLGPVLFENATYDIEGIVRRKADRGIVGYVFTDSEPRIVFTDPSLKARQAEIDARLPGTLNRVTSESADARRAIVVATGAREPGAVYLYEAASGTLTLLGRRNPGLTAAALAPVVPWRYDARDGTPIEAFVTLPPGVSFDDTRAAIPVVVMPHGGPATRDYVGFDYMAQFLASRGYAVLQMNFRGSSGYGRSFEARGFGEWGGVMQDDVTDGTRALIARGFADPKRIAIVGGSYGGYAALMGAVREPDLYRCAASINGVTDLKRFVEDMRDFRFADLRLPRILEPGVSLDTLAETSPVKRVAEIRAPILLIHGGLDRIVPVMHGRIMARALEQAGKPYEFVILQGGNHILSRERSRIETLSRLEAFLKAHMT